MLSDSISWIFSAVVCSIGEARFAGNSESKWHLVGDNLATLVVSPFILLSIIQSEKINRNQIISSQQRRGITHKTRTGKTWPSPVVGKGRRRVESHD